MNSSFLSLFLYNSVSYSVSFIKTIPDYRFSVTTISFQPIDFYELPILLTRFLTMSEQGWTFVDETRSKLVQA